MGLKNTTWQDVKPGQIVKFRYKGRNETRRKNRTVLCINPEIFYKKKNGRQTKFFLGLQLDTSDTVAIKPGDFNKIILRLGGLLKDDGTVMVGVAGQDLTGDLGKAETEQIVLKLQKLMKYYRSFNLRECKRSRVFVETSYEKIPKNLIELFNISEDTMETNED